MPELHAATAELRGGGEGVILVSSGGLPVVEGRSGEEGDFAEAAAEARDADAEEAEGCGVGVGDDVKRGDGDDGAEGDTRAVGSGMRNRLGTCTGSCA